MESFAKEIPADLTTSPALLNLLGSPKIRISPKSEENESSPSFTPSYLSQPNTGYQPITDYEPIVNKSIPFSTSGEYKLSRGINLLLCSFKCLVIASLCFIVFYRASLQVENRLFHRFRLHRSGD